MKDLCIEWYLVFTKPNHEVIAKINLERQGFDVYLPLFQQHKRRRNLYRMVVEPLFPRYLFVCLNSSIENWGKIRSTRGCISLVRFGLLPACIPNNLIEGLKQDEKLRLAQSETSTPDFKSGDRVQILEGVLSNYEGIVDIKNSQQRITLLLTISEGHTQRVSLSIHQVRMAN